MHALTYLGFVANEDVIFHRKGDIINAELQISSFGNIHKAYTSPGWITVLRIFSLHNRHTLKKERFLVHGPMYFRIYKPSQTDIRQVTYRSKLCIFCLVHVMVQGNKVKTGLHLVTASAWHVLPTLTKPCLWRTTEERTNINMILSSVKNLESAGAMKARCI